jgi:hypothetical protein
MAVESQSSGAGKMPLVGNAHVMYNNGATVGSTVFCAVRANSYVRQKQKRYCKQWASHH